MKVVTLHSNWGYWDFLDGTALRDGESLRVQWPDGTVTEERCCIEHDPKTASDHGHECEIPNDRAWVVGAVNGAGARVYLRQPGVLCERIPT